MRLIDADALLERNNAYTFFKGARNGKSLYDACRTFLVTAVDDAPTIEAEVVKHGRWKYTGCFLCECQNCGEIYSRYANDGKDWNYCPNCGAKMDLEE